MIDVQERSGTFMYSDAANAVDNVLFSHGEGYSGDRKITFAESVVQQLQQWIREEKQKLARNEK